MIVLGEDSHCYWCYRPRISERWCLCRNGPPILVEFIEQSSPIVLVPYYIHARAKRGTYMVYLWLMINIISRLW